MPNTTDMLHYYISRYTVFVYCDAAESILTARNIAHIFEFQKCLMSILSPKDESAEQIFQMIYKNIDEIIGSKTYTQKYQPAVIKFIHTNYPKTMGTIDNFRKIDALISKECIESLFNDDNLRNCLYYFFRSYDMLNELHCTYYKDLLVEFHNALSHIVTAAVAMSQSEQTSELKEYVKNNIKRACSHLRRGGKDAVKLIIKAYYNVLDSYNNNEEKDKFIKGYINIRFFEVMNISNAECSGKLESDLSNFGKELLSKLHADINLKTYFLKELKQHTQ